MDKATAAIPASLDETGSSRLRKLEARYIELLEKRVADLEAILSNTDKESHKSTKEGQEEGKDLTSNDRVAKFLSNGSQHEKDRRESISSSRPSKIQFRDIKYNSEGVEEPVDVSEKEAAKVDPLVKPKDSPDLVWIRRFDTNNKYDYSEVQIVSRELQDLFRIEFSFDPRLHFSSEKKNELTLTSPFEPLIHNWQRLQEFVKHDCDSEVWKELKKRIAAVRVSDKLGDTTNEVNILKAKDDLMALLNQVRTTPDLSNFLTGLETAKTSGTIHFNLLWTLFPPGELVYSTAFMKQDQVFIVKESPSVIHTKSDSGRDKDRKRVWYLYCWSYDWNGTSFNRVPVSFQFDEFQGARIIHSLPCHPLISHFPGEKAEEKLDKLKQDLITRGKQFRDHCTREVGSQMFEYEGESISHGSGFQRLKNKQKEESGLEAWFTYLYGTRRGTGASSSKQAELRRIGGRVMVDFDSYIQHAPNMDMHAPMGDVVFSDRDDECRCSSCNENIALRKNQRRDYDNWTEPFLEEQYLLCPPRVLGYHLDTRTWLELDVQKVEQINQPVSDAAFTKLQLNPNYKRLIKNLVESHTSGTGKKPMMEDIVKTKGRGLVILLHGPPGVGKTLTAESVASMAGKPLFAVSPSDIGLDPAIVEHNLESLFELAARWRAVLLFDEADVFLESRSANNSDLTRNALVSVLLRVLEYYSGILILTTNRVNQFDIAVQSRVNLGIKYDDLDKDQKRDIFAQFLDQVKPEDIDGRQKMISWMHKDPDGIDYFSSLNGRQVRNVLFSAASLASKDGGVLKLEHIEKMAKITSRFQDSLKVVMQNARMKSEAGRYGD